MSEFRFSRSNIELIRFILEDTEIESQNSLRILGNESINLKLRRPNWNRTSINNYYLFKILTVKSTESTIYFRGVKNYQWGEPNVDIKILEVYRIDVSKQYLIFNFINDNYLKIELGLNFYMRVIDNFISDKALFVKVNGSLKPYNIWLKKYNNSIDLLIEKHSNNKRLTQKQETKGLGRNEDINTHWNVNVKISYYDEHPMLIAESGESSYDFQNLEGLYIGRKGQIRSELLHMIESSFREMHIISCNVLNYDIDIDLHIYGVERGKHREVKLAFYQLEQLILREGEVTQITNVDVLNTVIVFTDDTTEQEVTGEDHLEFIESLTIDNVIKYKYDSSETGAGHWSDTVIFAAQTIGTGLLINEISRRYQNYIESKDIMYKPFKYYDLSTTVLKILKEHKVDSSNSKIIFLETEEVSFDLHVHVKTQKGVFKFVIDSKNQLIQFVIDN